MSAEKSGDNRNDAIVIKDDLEQLIGELGPEVSWVNELSVPSPAEIRERVSRFTPEQRTAAEREAIRAELGDTALSLAKGLISRGDLDDAEKWLRVAEQHHVPEARELLDELAIVPRELLDCPTDEFERSEHIVGAAIRRAAAIIEEAKTESGELIDSALAKVQQILDVTRYNAAKTGLLTSLAGLAKADPGGMDPGGMDPGGSPRKPTLLWLLWALLGISGVPMAKPRGSGTLSAIRVPKGTAMAGMLSPMARLTTRIGGGTGLAFRVFLLPSSTSPTSSRSPCTSQLLRLWDKTRLNRYQEGSRYSECRLVVALPHVLNSESDLEGDLLAALIEHLIPNHGLTLDQVRRLAWEAFDELAAERDRETASLTGLYEMIRPHSDTCPPNRFLAVDGVVQVQTLHENSLAKDDYRHAEDRDQRKLSVNGTDRASDAATNLPLPTRAPGLRADTAVTGTGSSLGEDPQQHSAVPHDEGPAGTTAPLTMTIEQALRALNDTGEDYFVFNDVDSGHPTVVYQRAGTADHGVMRLEDVEQATIDSVGEEAKELLSTSTPSSPDPAAGPSQSGADEGYDEYLIIETTANPA